MQRVVSCHRRVAATAAGVWRTMGASVQLVDGSGVVMVSQPPAGTVMMTHRRGFAKAKKGMKGRPGQVSWSKRQQKKRGIESSTQICVCKAAPHASDHSFVELDTHAHTHTALVSLALSLCLVCCSAIHFRHQVRVAEPPQACPCTH